MRKIAMLFFIFLLIPTFLVGCKTPSSIGIRIGDQPKVVDRPGPPDHAKAYGRRAKHKYNYYPSAGVYYDTGSGNYFYLEGSAWRMSVSLPSSLKVSLGSSVSIEMDTDKPYVEHEKHKKQYPPGKGKKKNKGKGKGNKNKNR